MQDVIANTAKKNSHQQTQTRSATDDNTALQRRYGQIGISAVAAAARYQGEAKNPAYAPVPIKPHDRGTGF